MVPDQAGQGVKFLAQRFAVPVRVYYEDTDAGGIVYYATYLRFMERARTDLLRHLGYGHQRLANEFGVQFVVTELAVKYLKPALLDDLLDVTAQVETVGHARTIFAQTIERRGELLTRASVTVACVQVGGVKPVPIPQSLRLTMKGQM